MVEVVRICDHAKSYPSDSLILSPHDLQDVMRDFKKFTSKKIVEHCQLSSNLAYLSKFEQAGERDPKGQIERSGQMDMIRVRFSLSVSSNRN